MERNYSSFTLPASRLNRGGRKVIAQLAWSGALALAVLALGGCGSSPPLFLKDGRATTLVQCRDGSDSCTQQARADCGGDFDVVRSTTNNGTLNLIYACRAK